MGQLTSAGDHTNQSFAIISTAQAEGIPPWILAGVWGLETDFGRDVHTSSAGAVGDFQFLPSTAKAYGYPLTNNPSLEQWDQQLTAAAKYLAALKKRYGTWNAALEHYSGGGYGEAKVSASAKKAPSWLSSVKNYNGPIGGPAGAAVNAASSAANTVGSVASGVGSIASLLTSVDFWKRLGEALLGVILLAMGLRSLTGNTTSPASVVTAAAKAVPK